MPEYEPVHEPVYEHAEKKTVQEISFLVEQTCRTSDSRWKKNWRMLGLDGKVFTKSWQQTASRAGETKEEFEKRVEACMAAYAAAHIGDLRSQLTDAGSPVTMAVYVRLSRSAIQGLNKWAGKADEYWNIWDHQLRAAFGDLRISDCTSQSSMEDVMEPITHRKKRKMGRSETERTYWVILGGILEAAVLDKLLADNPLRALMRECKVKLSTIASRDLARASLTEEELRGLWNACLKNGRDSDVYPAMQLQALTGLTVYELCALNVGDWKRSAWVSWLEVTKAYKQKRGEAAAMTGLLHSANAYRNVACSAVAEKVLGQQLARLRAEKCAPKDQPLFREPGGGRLTPQTYKKALSVALDPLIREGVHLPFAERGSFLTGKDRPTLSHGELLRTTMEYYCRNAGMNVSEIAAILGKDREHTFAISYVDWNSEQILMYQKAKLDRWQAELLLGAAEGGRHSVNHGFLIHGMAEEGAKITVRAPHGMRCAIEEYKEDAV